MKNNEQEKSPEFSKTLRFDFPRIPIIGVLLLGILLLNYPGLLIHFEDEKGKYSLGAMTAVILAMGTAGITCAQLVSLSAFDSFFRVKRKLLENGSNIRSSYDWLEHIQAQAEPVTRSQNRAGIHDIEMRISIKKMTPKQRHAALHALEMECRRISPVFGVQLEYYYSTYLFFFCSGAFAFGMLALGLWKETTNDSGPSLGVLLFDFAAGTAAIAGTVATRRMAEYLRVILFNHDRKFALRLLSTWYQCRIGEHAPEKSAA